MFKPSYRISIEDCKEIKAAMGDNTPSDVEDALDRDERVNNPKPFIRGGVIYTKPEHRMFILDAEDNGYEIAIYHGRNYWHGPAVRLEAGDRGFITDVPVQYDGLGRGQIVYPAMSDSSLKDAQEN